ncbi:glycine cleavage system aminomethyltransferase GcvT [Haladaptatus sp. CMSO5]|uniref:glycine cleavage system aminomethyltransferase GcvT n=1 Tax=Haladaptatus sp. CMSO5 TaxID=3120514 RepID=UPI002FCE35D9
MSLRESPLGAIHREHDAKMTDFGGWAMPVKYTSITHEHDAVRNAVGIFDVSHMGEVFVSGPDATELMNRLTTNDVADLSAGDAQYACITREDGIIVDDTVVYLLPDGETYLFIPNAGHDEEMESRWRDHADCWNLSVIIENRTLSTGMVAVQGPHAVERVNEEASTDVSALGRFSVCETAIGGVECHVARTGYTGEDGFEIVFDADDAAALWNTFEGVQPCGLGARDTLRLEAGLLLSGQDFHPEIEPRTPFEAGLGFVVSLDTEFVGRDALVDADPDQSMVGIELDGRGVPRAGCSVLKADEHVGELTSGTMSPTLDLPIGIGYVDADVAEPGTDVEIDIRGRSIPATVETPRFLQRHQ